MRRRVRQADVRDAFRQVLPFEAEIIICDGAKVRALMARDPFAGYPVQPNLVRFISVLGGRPDVEPLLPIEFRHGRQWLLKLIARSDCFVLGIYRRHSKTISYLSRVDRMFEVPITTRNWNTFGTIAATMDSAATRARQG